MGKGQENLITAIDVGSTKTCVLVAEADEAGLRYFMGIKNTACLKSHQSN